MEKITSDLRWNIIYLAAQEEKIRTIFKLFRVNGIEPILIKGWSVSRYFPADISRLSMDIDIAVGNSDYAASKKLAESTNINLDLHDELRHLDIVSYQNLFEHSQLTKIADGYEIRVLCPEDNLRIICTHWLNDGGIKKDRLWDIYYCVKNRPADFVWDRCLNIVGKTRRKWILAAILAAHHYFNLSIKDLPFAEEITQPNFIPSWFFRTLEKEWNSEVALNPLNASIQDFNTFFQQIRKRFPPNPITATIQTNSQINNFPRLPIQLYNMLRRLFPTETNNQSPFNLIINKSFKQK